jgi:hypothetical protein
MKSKHAIIASSLVFFVLVALFSFKATTEGKKVTILRYYTSAIDDFNNAITVCTPDGTAKKYQLLQHKAQNYEINDKMLTLQINTLIEKGLRLTSMDSYGDKSLFITTYIFE